jgi:protein-L-isoaspartate(D-aspartate) O-methyltransferase
MRHVKTATFHEQREEMVQTQIVARGVVDPLVLAAMREVPREEFVGARYHEFAYEDSPLPIEEGQTISQPYIVALMLEAVRIGPADRVLEVGAGSGYASAVISRMAGSVHAIERHRTLADIARARLTRLGYDNVTVVTGDGTKGLSQSAPYDAIIVSAGGTEVPEPLLEQLRIGGRLIIPVGNEPRTQELLRIVRTGVHSYDRDALGHVRFVPLIGTEGWAKDGHAVSPRRPGPTVEVKPGGRDRLGHAIAAACEPLLDQETASLDALLARIDGARIVMIGESTHGTSEFYRMRNRITRELVMKQGFTIVAIEGDWPDVAVLDRHVHGKASAQECRDAFARFPAWMWRNRETAEFIDWLAAHNLRAGSADARVGMYGLDLYSLGKSIAAVLAFLDREDPRAAEAARVRYGCFSPWETDPATYGRATASGRLEGCENEAVTMLRQLLEMRLTDPVRSRDPLFDAQRNAAVVREAERYYRAMYYGARESWNLRDRHMFATLQSVLEHRGPKARAVVWAHNSHVGDATATEMAARGETNLGKLARHAFGAAAYLIGMGTDRGTVAAASGWDEPMRVRALRNSHPESFEALCRSSGVPRFLLPLRASRDPALREALAEPRIERAVGVIYRPDTEILSHYFQASVARQFDEWVWFEETKAVDAVEGATEDADPGTYPFAL